MKIVFFDTETTGIIKEGDPLSSQPHIIELGYICKAYPETTFEDKFEQIYRPPYPIPSKITQLTGINDSMVKGCSIFNESAQFTKFLGILAMADIIVGHNVDFDIRMIEIECRRLVQRFPEKENDMKKFIEAIFKKSFCTMRTTVEFVKIPGKIGYKYPKLMELYQWCFGETFENSHSAMADIEATEKCFYYLMEKDIIKIK